MAGETGQRVERIARELAAEVGGIQELARLWVMELRRHMAAGRQLGFRVRSMAAIALAGAALADPPPKPVPDDLRAEVAQVIRDIAKEVSHES